jgi:hypothetical protein
MKASAIISIIITVVLLALLISVILALPVMWLWNATLPELFKFPEIGLWMAWKLAFLSSLLFKSTSTTTSKS